MLASEDKKKAVTSLRSVFQASRRRRCLRGSQQGREDRLLQVATEEGMGEGEHSLFTGVKKAQGKLDVDVLEQGGAPTKVGP